MAGIVRNDVDALIETQVANEIFEGTIRQSKALSMLKRSLVNLLQVKLCHK